MERGIPLTTIVHCNTNTGRIRQAIGLRCDGEGVGCSVQHKGHESGAGAGGGSALGERMGLLEIK